jgi:hypothetical protein
MQLVKKIVITVYFFQNEKNLNIFQLREVDLAILQKKR